MTDVTKFISGCMASLSAMVQLELPHVNILSKMDLVTSKKDIEEWVTSFFIFSNLFTPTFIYALIYLVSVLPLGFSIQSLDFCCLSWISAWLLSLQSWINLWLNWWVNRSALKSKHGFFYVIIKSDALVLDV